MHRYTGRCGRARKRPAERKKPGTQGRAATAALYTARVERADPRGAPAGGAEEPERPLKARGLFFGEDDAVTENDCIRCRGIAHFKHDSLHSPRQARAAVPFMTLFTCLPRVSARSCAACLLVEGRTSGPRAPKAGRGAPSQGRDTRVALPSSDRAWPSMEP